MPPGVNGEPPQAHQLGLFGRGEAHVGPDAAPVDGALQELAGRTPRALHLGTCSWSFPGWRGLVYDRTLPAQELARFGLDAYGRHPLLRCVNVDRTFYAPVPEQVFRAYAEAVPEAFRFVAKGHRDVVQAVSEGAASTRFLDAGYAAEALVGPFVEGAGAKAAIMVWAFPPQPAAQVGGAEAFADRLHRFLSDLPGKVTYAVELRTPELMTPSYIDALHDAGAVHCFNVHPRALPLGEQWRVARARRWPLLLVRWMLRRNLTYTAARERYHPFDRLVDEDVSTRRDVAALCERALAAGRPAFVLANNKAEGSAPLTLRRLAELLDKSGKKT